MQPFFGNTSTMEALQQYAKTDRFPHGILLLGDAGLGKKTLALQIAAMALCPAPHAYNQPCAVCSRVLRQTHPDVKLLRADNKSGTLSVKQLRNQVVEDSIVLPNEGKRKVYILADTLTVAGQNTLLKTLEEPPAYGMFILMATREDEMLPTVLSRVVTLRLTPLEPTEFGTALGEDCQDVMGLFALTGGNLGQAKRLLEDGKGNRLLDLCGQLFGALMLGKEYDFLSVLSNTDPKDGSQTLVLQGLCSLLRQAISLAMGMADQAHVSHAIVPFQNRLRVRQLTHWLALLLTAMADHQAGRNQALFASALTARLFTPQT